MIEIITKIYIGANLFFAGYYLADTYKWQDTKIKKITCLLWCFGTMLLYRDWETDRKSTRLNSSHSGESRMPSSA